MINLRILTTLILIALIAPSAHAILIDDLVYEEVSEKGLADVIVVLKERSIKSMIIGQKEREFESINGFTGKISKHTLSLLSNDTNVIGIQANSPVNTFLAQSVPLVNANQTWQINLSGHNITGHGKTVCVVDTGVNYNHPALAGKIIGGYDFFNNDDDPMDDDGHGTHVAGIIASNDAIFRGVAYGANIAAVKVLSPDGGFESDVIAGIDWCISNAEQFNISVISMSLGSDTLFDGYCDDEKPAFSEIINEAISNNISVVVATGNAGSITKISAPACIQNATAIGAVYDSSVGPISPCFESNAADKITCYTNRNFATDLFGPGSVVTSTWYTGGFQSLQGTSMATPVVSAAFALVHQFKELDNGILLTPAELENLFKTTGKNLSDSSTGLTFKRVDILSTIKILDTNAPYVSITSPLNTTYQQRIINLSVSASDVSIDRCWYVNSTNDTVFLNNATRECNTAEIIFDAVNNNITVFVNDSRGNTNSSTVFFTVDYPLITIESPDSIFYNTTQILLNFSVYNLTPISSIWYQIDDSENITLINSSPTNFTSPEGIHTLTLFVNDSVRVKESNVSFIVDVSPEITILNITPDKEIINSTGNLTINIIFNTNLSAAVLEWDSINNTMNFNDSWFYDFTNLTAGNHTFRVYANNTAGFIKFITESWIYLNINSTNATSHDDKPPSIIITSPSGSYSSANVQLIYQVSDNVAVDSCWYILNGGSNISLQSCNNSTITAISGINSLDVYANDTAGNINSSHVTFNYEQPAPAPPPAPAPASSGGGGGGFTLQPAPPKNVTKVINNTNITKPPEIVKHVPQETTQVELDQNKTITPPVEVAGIGGLATALPTLPLWAESAVAGLIIAISSIVFWKYRMTQIKKKK